MHGKRVLCFVLIFVMLFQNIIYARQVEVDTDLGVSAKPVSNTKPTTSTPKYTPSPAIKATLPSTTTTTTTDTTDDGIQRGGGAENLEELKEEAESEDGKGDDGPDYGFLTPLVEAINDLIETLSPKEEVENYEEYSYDDELFKQMIEEMLNDTTLNKKDSYYKLFNESSGSAKIAHFPLHVKNNMEASSIATLSDKIISVNTERTGLSGVLYKWDLGTPDLYSQYLKDRFRIKNSLVNNYIDPAGGGVDKDYYSYMNYYLNAKYFEMNYDTSTLAVGMDNYGNIITNKGDVLVPFYMNEYIINKVRDKLNIDEKDSFVVDRLKDEGMRSRFKKFQGHDGSHVELDIALINDSGEIDKFTSTTSELVGKLSEGEGNTDDMVNFIYDNFSEAVKEYNLNIFETAQSNPDKRELYQGESDYDYPNLNEDPMAQLDLKLKRAIMTIIEGGFGELLTLTWAYLVNVAYQELFIDFSSRYIFNTSTLRDTGSYYVIRNMYSAISIALIILLFVISMYRFLGGESTIRKTLSQILVVTLIFFIPFQIYPILTDMVMNEPVEKILDEQINQIMLMDRWLQLDKERFDARKEALEIELVKQSRVFRKSDFNYTVAFRTREHIGNLYGGTKNLSQINSYGETEAKTKASKAGDDRYTVNVELGHLIDYYKYNTSENTDTGNTDYSLFNFLINEYPDDYSGLTGFSEFEMYVTSDTKSRDYSTFKYSALNKDSVETEGFITASEIGKMVFEYYDDIEQGEAITTTNTFNANDIAERGRIITEKVIFNPKKTGQNKDEIINRLHDGLIEYDDDGNIIYDYTKLLDSAVTVNDIESEQLKDTTILMQDLVNSNSKDSGQSASDTFMIYNLLYSMAQSSSETINKADKIKINKMAEEINAEVYDYYLNNFWDIENTKLSDGSVGDSLYKTALKDLLKLKISFEITERLVQKYGKYSYQDRMPTNIDFGRVQGDVYLKSLVIPVNELNPGNRSTDTAALYVTTTKSAFTHIFFIALVIILALYGLLKYGIVSIAIVPIAIFMTIFKFIRHKENDDYMAAWVGAGYILGIFGAVNLGLITVITMLIQGLNTTVSSDLSGGMNMFSSFVTVIVTLAYIAISFKFILIPTVKIAAQNIGDLGASQFNSIAKNVTDKVKDSVAGRTASSALKAFKKSRDSEKPKTKAEELKDKKKELGLGDKTGDKEKYKSSKDLVDRVTKDSEEETGEVKSDGAKAASKAGGNKQTTMKNSDEPLKVEIISSEKNPVISKVLDKKPEERQKPKAKPKTSKELAELLLAEQLNEKLQEAKVIKNTGANRVITEDGMVEVTDENGKVTKEKMKELSKEDVKAIEEDFAKESKYLGKELTRNFNNIERIKANTKEKKVFTNMKVEDTTIFQGDDSNIEEIARDLGRNKVKYELIRNKDGKSTIKVKTSELPEANKYDEIEGVEQNGYRDMTVSYDKKLAKTSKNWLGANDTLIENEDGTMTIRKEINEDSNVLEQDKYDYSRAINEEAAKLKLEAKADAMTFKGTRRELKSLAYMAEKAGETGLAEMIRANCDSGELELSKADYDRVQEKMNKVGTGSEAILGEKKYVIDSILRNNPIKTAEELSTEQEDYLKNKIQSTISNVGEEVKSSFKNRIQELAELNKKNKGE